MRIRRRIVAPTVRVRMSAIYAGVILLSGGVLLAVSYGLVQHNLTGPPPPPGRPKPVAGGVGTAPVAPPGPAPKLSPLGSVGGGTVLDVRHQLAVQTLHNLLLQYGVALAGITLASLALGWILAGRALRPLAAITATARRISRENLHERIELHGPADELRELAETFDTMLDRLEAAFARQRHFIANAAHELRTPLSVIRAEVDVLVANPHATLEDLGRATRGLRAAIERSERLMESLLTLASSEHELEHPEPLDLHDVVAAATAFSQSRLEQAHIHLSLDLRPARIYGDYRSIERLVANLLDNGIEHNQAGGWLAFGTSEIGETAVIETSNGGSVITEDPALLLEPFRRAGRQRTGRGFGLGLSIVQTIAHAHGGTVEVTTPAVGGLWLRVLLPTGTAGGRPVVDGPVARTPQEPRRGLPPAPQHEN
jgi:signal transduction histidine kinase